MKLKTLRHYQEKGINLLRQAIREKFTRIMFFLATGGGKSIVFVHLVYNLLIKNSKVVFIVKRRDLVFQAAEHLKMFFPSILMGDEKGFDPTKKLQICSIDTLTRRNIEFLDDFDFCLIDEAHDYTSEKNLKTLNELKCKYFIGFSATPFPVGKKVHSFFQCCVKPIEMHELRDQGFLVDEELYVPDTTLDLSEVKKLGGDYQDKDLSKKMTEITVIGDTVDLYKKYGQGLPAVFFGVTKEHSLMVCEAFNKAGIRAIHCDESTKTKDREAAKNEAREYARRREPHVVCNVNIFSTGTDVIEWEVIFPKPTLSEILWIQQGGRVLRPYRLCGKCKTGYDNSPACPVCGYDKPTYIKHRAIVIDQGNNRDRLGSLYDVRFAALKDSDIKKDKGEKEILYKTCARCFRSYLVSRRGCPNCDSSETKERFFKTVAGEFRPYDEWEAMNNYYKNLLHEKSLSNYKDNWVAFQMYKKFSQKVMKYKREFSIPSWVPKMIKKQAEEKISGKVYDGNNEKMV